MVIHNEWVHFLKNLMLQAMPRHVPERRGTSAWQRWRAQENGSGLRVVVSAM
jgi:hypothetical protein